jgi:replicative DNA helicase
VHLNESPQNIEAEMSLLGSILLDKEAVLKVADLLTKMILQKCTEIFMYHDEPMVAMNL